MFELEVIQETENWHKGDHIEANKERADELVSLGVAVIVKQPEEKEEVKVEKPVVKSKAQKGVK